MCNNTDCKSLNSSQQPWQFLDFRPLDEYEDNFGKHLGHFLTKALESDDEFLPYGLYPYLFAGTNPYQLGDAEEMVFQDNISKNLPNTTVEKVLLEIPFIYYVSLWMCLEFVAILIFPLMGMILFRFVTLPIGQLIGGKHTRKYLRHVVIMIEKFRRAKIRWEWPEGSKLPPWRFRTPRLLRFPHEEAVPWELMDEKEAHRLILQYPERWQLDARLKEWKDKATKPECYADKWVFKMIHRKLLRDKKFHKAPHKFKWGGSDSSSSSGTSTSSEEDNYQKESFPEVSLGSKTMSELSHINSGLYRVSPDPQKFNDKEKHRGDYKQRIKTVFKKRDYKEELRSHRASKMGIVLDQNDTRWPKYSGELFDRDKILKPDKSKLRSKPWNLVKLSLGPRELFLDAKSSWKPVRKNIKLRKMSIDNLTSRSGNNESGGLTKDSTPDLVRLEKLRKIKEITDPKRIVSKRPRKPTKSDKMINKWKSVISQAKIAQSKISKNDEGRRKTGTKAKGTGKYNPASPWKKMSQALRSKKSVIFQNVSKEDSYFTIKTIDISDTDIHKKTEKTWEKGKSIYEYATKSNISLRKSLTWDDTRPRKSIISNDTLPRKSIISNDTFPRKSMTMDKTPSRKSVTLEDTLPGKSMASDKLPPRKSMTSDQQPPRKSMTADDTLPRKSMPADNTLPRKSMTSDKISLKKIMASDETSLRRMTLDNTFPRKSMTSSRTLLRKSMTSGKPPLRKSMTSSRTLLRKSMTSGKTPLRKSMTSDKTPLRKSMTSGKTPLRKSMTSDKTPLRKSMTSDKTPLRKSMTSDKTPLRKSMTSDKTPLKKNTVEWNKTPSRNSLTRDKQNKTVSTEKLEQPVNRQKSNSGNYVTVVETASLFDFFKHQEPKDKSMRRQNVGVIDETGTSKLDKAHRDVSTDSDEPPSKKRKSQDKKDDNDPSQKK